VRIQGNTDKAILETEGARKVEMAATFLLCLFAYCLGAIPTGYWLGKLLKGIDIRTVGSGSTGATNVLRSVGKGPAVFVLFFDMFKGALPVILGISACQAAGQQIIPLPAVLMLRADAAADSPFMQFMIANLIPAALGGIVAMIGHARSIFLGFGGGKSAATGLGSLAAMSPLTAVCMFAVFVSTIFITRYVSLGSILGAISGPFFMYYFTHGQISFVIYNIVASSYVIVRHKSNIKRLLAGTELKFGQKAEVKTEQAESKPGQADAKAGGTPAASADAMAGLEKRGSESTKG
jgi:acyl phosphate:glycerol-3-phosphate acyltransferase